MSAGQWVTIAERCDHPLLDTPAALQHLVDNFTGPVPIGRSASDAVSWVDCVRSNGSTVLGRLTRTLPQSDIDVWRVAVLLDNHGPRIVDIFIGFFRRRLVVLKSGGVMQ